MKHGILLLFLTLSFTASVFAQETTEPLTDIEIVRSVKGLDIEGKLYLDVKITLESVSPDYYFSDVPKVKFTVVDKEGKRVLKESFKNVYLYVFSSGQVQVGRKNFNMIVIQKSDDGQYYGLIREKEGVF